MTIMKGFGWQRVRIYGYVSRDVRIGGEANSVIRELGDSGEPRG
jgi:hypothetical protein